MNELILARFSYCPDTGVLIHNGRVCKPRQDGYIRVCVDYKPLYAHRVIWFLMTGNWPTGTIDHINRNPTDNRWCNLRDVTHRENLLNVGTRANSKTGISGVTWDADNKRFRSAITVDKNKIHLCSTKDFFEAVCSRKSAEVRYGFIVG